MEHPLSSEESFSKWCDDTLGCVHCNYLGKSNLPVEQWKCTHELAYSPSRDYPNGYEGDKDVIRKFLVEQAEKKGEPLSSIKDANFNFMCPMFDDSKDGRKNEWYNRG
jgi:hypothetical protein